MEVPLLHYSFSPPFTEGLFHTFVHSYSLPGGYRCLNKIFVCLKKHTEMGLLQESILKIPTVPPYCQFFAM